MTRAALFAVAASVLAAGFLLVGGSSVALADVVKAAEKHTLVKYRATFWHEQKEWPAYERPGTCYADIRAPRHRYEERKLVFNDYAESDSSCVIDWTADRMLSLNLETLVPNKPVEKFFLKVYDAEAHKFPQRFASLARARPVDCEPSEDQRKPFLDRLRALAGHPKAKSQKDAAHGPKVVKFRIEDGFRTTELWVNTDTNLPVRLWYERLEPMIGDTTRWTYTDFEWDPTLPAGVKSLDELFTTTPPAGYELTDETGKK